MNDPSDGGGSNISHVVREFGIGEIGAFAVVVDVLEQLFNRT